MRWDPALIVEVGPGGALCTLVGKCLAAKSMTVTTVQSMRHPKDESANDNEILASVVGRIWCLPLASQPHTPLSVGHPHACAQQPLKVDDFELSGAKGWQSTG
jgi:hypothetical protein